MSFSITPSVFNCFGEESGGQYSLPFTDRLANGDSAANSSTWCDLPSENSAMERKPGGARAPMEADAISKEILFRLQCVPPWMAWACDKPTSFETRRARKGLERLTRSPSASLLVGACRQRGAGSKSGSRNQRSRSASASAPDCPSGRRRFKSDWIRQFLSRSSKRHGCKTP